MSDDELPDSLGRYKVIRRLGTGGMAEVFLAKSTGAEGIEKVLVVKRVLPSFARSAKFITMFVDEAKVAMRLNHPNIVQVYAFEEAAKDFLLAMEFVDGLDLGRLVAACRRKNKRIPYGLAAFIVMECAKGLDYAHKRKDAAGEPMEIVHRDVSPQNLLVTYDGVVKVADFGIAKARLVSEETGVIKGKFAYMSPEQARGQRVDHRSDVYALGVLLGELLMNRTMYPGEHGLDVLEKVRDAKLTLPREVDPEVPRQLERIVRRCTSADREERYQTARALAGALAQYLHGLDEFYDGEALENFVASVAPRERTSPEGPQRPIQTFAGGATVLSGITKERRERRRVMVVAGRFRGDSVGMTNAGTGVGELDAKVGSEIAKVLGDIAYKADAVLSWPDGLGKARFRFIIGLGKASVNDPLKATRIAGDTIEALEGLSADLFSPVSASLGMSRGLVSTARDANGRLLRYAPIGDILDVAERLAETGRAGEVRAAGEVYRLVRRDFAFDSKPVEVAVGTNATGQHRALAAWTLRGALTQEERRAGEVEAAGVFGRDNELRHLVELYDEAKLSKRTQFVSIFGELGMGKSLLLAATRKAVFQQSEVQDGDAPGDHPRVLRVECAFGAADVPYAVTADLLRDACGIADGASPTQCAERFEDALDDLVEVEHREQVRQTLGPILGIGVRGALPGNDGDRARIVARAVAAIIAGLAKTRPVLIQIDSLQRADTPSLELLAAMHQRGYDAPCLVMLASRRDDRVLSVLSGIPEVELGPLPSADRRELIRCHFEAEVPEEIHRAIDDRAGGNPFFIIELVDSLLEREVVRVEGSGERRRVVRKPGAAIQLPTTLEGAIAARLDELSEGERIALRWLSVAGAGLTESDLTTLIGGNQEEHLAGLVDRGLIVLENDGEIGFPSAVVRQVAYEATDVEDRTKMHRRIAQHLRSHEGEPGRIARHLEQAGERSAAATAYLDAADSAREVHGNREALRFFGRALALMAPDEVEGRFRAHVGREGILRSLGRTHEQLREIEMMRTLATRGGGPRRRALASLRLARFDLDGGRYGAVAERLPDVLQVARAAGDDEVIIDTLLLETELARYRGEPERALRAADEALERAGLDRQLLSRRADVLVERGIILRRLGRATEAFEAYAEAIVIYRRLQLPRREAFVLNSFGVALASAGNYEDAIIVIRASLLLDRQTGDRMRLGRKLSNVGQLYAALGDNRRGLSFVKRSLDCFEAIDDRSGRCDALSAFAEMLFEEGHEPAVVATHLDQAKRTAERLETGYDLARERIVRARIERAGGRLGKAKSAAEEAVRQSKANGLHSYEVHGLSELAQAQLALGEAKDALKTARQAREKAGDGAEVEHGERVLWELCEVFDQAGAEEDAQDCGAAAAGILDRKAMAIREVALREGYLATPYAKAIRERA